jgi:DNA-binding transcriptional MerR regulator
MIEQERTWKIGELARETGLSVRTLHHYDQLGLLSAASRTEGGHRCYAGEDVRRLNRIVALRSMGASLEDIRALLDGADDPVDLLRRQLDGVDERIRLAVVLRTRLQDALRGLADEVEPSSEQLLQVIEDTVTMDGPLSPERRMTIQHDHARQVRGLSPAEFAAFRRKTAETWKALSRQEQGRLMEQRRRLDTTG